MIKYWATAAMAVCVAMAASVFAKEPSTLALVGPATTPAVEMSPGGRYFAIINRSLDPDEEPKLLFVDSTGEEQPITVPLGKDTDYLGMAWVNDDRLIFLGSQFRKVRVSTGGRVEINVVRMFSIDRTGKDTVILFEDSESVAAAFSPPDVLNILPDDPEHIIMSAVGNTRDTLDLWKVNIFTGDTKLLYKGFDNTFSWFLDANGTPVFRTVINDRQTFIKTYVSPDKGETWEQVHEQVVRNIGNEPLRFQPLGPAATPGRYTIIAQRPGADRMAVHEYDLRTKEFVRTLYEHPTVDVTAALEDPMTGEYLGARYAVDKFEYAVADPELKPAIEALEQALGPDVSFGVSSMSSDRQRMLLRTDGPQAPGDYYLFDRSKMSLDFLLSSRPELDPAQLHPVEIMRETMSDGVEITSYVTHPGGDRTGVYPLIVVPHGGPQSRDYYAYDLFGQFFASRGYRVIQTNFRGSAGYGEDFVEAGHREWGKRMQADVMESAEALIGRGIAQKKNMCVYGWSYGGYVAMTASYKNTDLFSASISTAGVSHLRDSLVWERVNFGLNSPAYQYWKKAIGDESDDRADLNENSAAENADRVTMPVLLFHGKDDFIVDVDQSRKFRGALKRAGKSVEYHEFAETGHGIVTFENDDLEFMFDRIDAFCKEHLPN